VEVPEVGVAQIHGGCVNHGFEGPGDHGQAEAREFPVVGAGEDVFTHR
jgi:hypothetical protein